MKIDHAMMSTPGMNLLNELNMIPPKLIDYAFILSKGVFFVKKKISFFSLERPSFRNGGSRGKSPTGTLLRECTPKDR